MQIHKNRSHLVCCHCPPVSDHSVFFVQPSTESSLLKRRFLVFITCNYPANEILTNFRDFLPYSFSWLHCPTHRGSMHGTPQGWPARRGPSQSDRQVPVPTPCRAQGRLRGALRQRETRRGPCRRALQRTSSMWPSLGPSAFLHSLRTQHRCRSRRGSSWAGCCRRWSWGRPRCWRDMCHSSRSPPCVRGRLSFEEKKEIISVFLIFKRRVLTSLARVSTCLHTGRRR